jgi:hypothetical protein
MMNVSKQLATWSCAGVLLATPALAPAQERGPIVNEVTLQGIVTAVDHTARTVTIRSQQNNTLVTVDVPTTIGRFDQVKVGDTIALSYYDRVNLRLKSASEPDIDRAIDPTVSATPGAVPGATIARQREATVKITAWDPATRTVSFTDPKGVSYTRRVAETVDPTVVSRIKVGERVDVTRTEALRLSTLLPQAPPAQSQVVSIAAQSRPMRRYSISAEWGPDNAFSGNMIEQASGQTVGGVPINLNETTYDDTYGRLFLFKVGFGYWTSPNSEVVFNFVLSRSDAETVDVGTVGASGLPLNVNFSEMDYWGLEGGQRFLFTPSRIKPFVGYLVGANRYDDVTGTFVDVPLELTPGLAAQDGKFFEKSWAFSAGPTGGVVVGMGALEVMAQVQFRFMGGLSDVDWLVEEGLRDVNSESERWSFPFTFGAGVRF